jgi:hypothetical protein
VTPICQTGPDYGVSQTADKMPSMLACKDTSYKMIDVALVVTELALNRLSAHHSTDSFILSVARSLNHCTAVPCQLDTTAAHPIDSIAQLTQRPQRPGRTAHTDTAVAAAAAAAGAVGTAAGVLVQAGYSPV